MKVFGVGLSRTGTTSLTAALGILGYDAIHFPLYPQQIEMADAATDTTVAYRFEELDRRYPESKFILTLRDEEAWLDSCERFFGQSVSIKLYPPELRALLQKSRMTLYGTMTYDREKFLTAYRRHHARVRDYFKDRPDDLLEFNLCEGWPRLCAFLDREIPDAPYPHENKKHWPLEKLPPRISRALRTPGVVIQMAFHVLRLRWTLR
jgi:hypothetical protein